MQLTIVQKTQLGLFVLIGLAVLLLVFVSLAGIHPWEQTNTYIVRFHDSVAGLEPRSSVKYQGLRVGRVASMRVSKQNATAIDVMLSIDASLPLYEGTTAVLDISGLTGMKVINLLPGNSNGPVLANGAMLPSGASIFDRLTDNVSSIVADIRRVTQQISTWVTPENRVRLESLVTNLNQFVAHLDTLIIETDKPIGKMVDEVTQTIHKIGATADEATLIMHEARGTVAHVEVAAIDTLHAVQKPLSNLSGSLIHDTVQNIMNVAVQLEKRLSDRETGEVIARFIKTIERVNGLVRDVDLILRASRDDFTQSIAYIRQAAEDLREFSRILAQNPSALLRGRSESR